LVRRRGRRRRMPDPVRSGNGERPPSLAQPPGDRRRPRACGKVAHMPRQPTDAAVTVPAELAAPSAELTRLTNGEHPDPHAILGPHPIPAGVAVRAFHPDADGVELLVDGARPRSLTALPDGLWE